MGLYVILTASTCLLCRKCVACCSLNVEMHLGMWSWLIKAHGMHHKSRLPNCDGLLRRFFCGPNAKKSAALAKQQKKRARGDGKRAAAKVYSDADAPPGGSDKEEAQALKKRRKGVAPVKKAPARNNKSSKNAGQGQAAGKCKAAGKDKAAKVRSEQDAANLHAAKGCASCLCAANEWEEHCLYQREQVDKIWHSRSKAIWRATRILASHIRIQKMTMGKRRVRRVRRTTPARCNGPPTERLAERGEVPHAACAYLSPFAANCLAVPPGGFHLMLDTGVQNTILFQVPNRLYSCFLERWWVVAQAMSSLLFASFG